MNKILDNTRSYRHNDSYDRFYYLDRSKDWSEARRKIYNIPIMRMITDKLTNVMTNDIIIENTKMNVNIIRQIVNEWYSSGTVGVQFYEDNYIVFPHNKIRWNDEKLVFISQNRYYVNTYDELIVYDVDDKDDIIDEHHYRTTSPQFMFINSEPRWLHLKDQIRAVEISYNNFVRDIYLGGKKVMMDKALIHTDENGNKVTPDDVAQELFTLVEKDMRERADTLFYEYNPDMRISQNKEAVSFHVGTLTSALGLGTNFILENRDSASYNSVIAWSTSNSEMVDTIGAICRTIKTALETYISSVEGHTCRIDFDYDFIVDYTAERESDRKDIEMGIMSVAEYRQKWYAEDKETAEANTPKNPMIGMELM